MKVRQYLSETNIQNKNGTFIIGNDEYYFKEVGKGQYTVAVFKKGGSEPNNVYKCTKIWCDCPSRKKCRHLEMLQMWIKVGKPSPFGKDPKKDVMKFLGKRK